MKLRELGIGYRFYPASQAMKRTPIFETVGKCVFNAKHGTSTRACKNLVTGEIVSKSCNLEVINKGIMLPEMP